MQTGFLRWLRNEGLTGYFDIEVFIPLSGTQDVSKLTEDFSYLKNSFDDQDDFSFEELVSRITSGEFAVLLIFIYDHSGNILYGHWVTVAGVCYSPQLIAISDPYFDVTNPTFDYMLHNDAAIVSHDIFEINSTIPFPHNGLWCLEDYENNCYTIVASAVTISYNSDIIITAPKTGFLSINNKSVISTIFGNTIIVGSTSLQAMISNNCNDIDEVEFYVDGELQSTDKTLPYIWEWETRSFGKHVIEIVAIDCFGGDIKSELSLWKFF